MTFKLHEIKTFVKSINVDDFMVVGSQQLKIIFQSHNERDLITDFNPISPIYSKIDVSNVPNSNVSKSLLFQIEKSKQSLDKARTEVNKNDESILSSCKALSSNIADQALIQESELVEE